MANEKNTPSVPEILIRTLVWSICVAIGYRNLSGAYLLIPIAVMTGFEFTQGTMGPRPVAWIRGTSVTIAVTILCALSYGVGRLVGVVVPQF
jgi:hypothetical protein